MPTYKSGGSFEVTWPPMVFNRPDDDSDNLGFVIDAEASRAAGWFQDANGTWVYKFPADEDDTTLADLEQDSIRREREEYDAELAKEYGELA